MNTEQTYQEFSDEIGAPVGTIKRWVHEGMPVRRLGPRVVVDTEPAYAWLAAKRPRLLRRTGVVYFARGADGRIKIGYSSDTRRRMRELNAALLATVPGNIGLEFAIQKGFASAHVEDEWFQPTTELLAFIDVLAYREAA